MEKYSSAESPVSGRIKRLVERQFQGKPRIEAERARYLTESFRRTEDQPMVLRRALAFANILDKLPIIIREEELIVGGATLEPRSSQTFPEFSFQWLEDEFETISQRSSDPFEISEDVKKELREIHTYWRGKTVSELALSLMTPETKTAMEHNIFTPGNYLYNGVGHVCVDYAKVLKIGFNGIRAQAMEELERHSITEADYGSRSSMLWAVIISCEATVRFALRYAELAEREAASCRTDARRKELLGIAANCRRVPAQGAESFYEACQSFWFVQLLLQLESNGHSVSPGRFDQYMYPYYKRDLQAGKIDRETAQELIDCVWVKLNDMSKCRDQASAEGFAGYSMFQNLIVGGQDKDGRDATNDLSFMCLTASRHVFLPQPSLSIRVWNGTPHELLLKAAELTRTGIGLPAYYNDEVIIPALMERGLSMEDARGYNIIGCVEPQKGGKTDGWHDAAFFNMCRPLELVFSNGRDKGRQISIETGAVEEMHSFEQFYDAYRQQLEYNMKLMVNADNAIDRAHTERCPLPFLSCMIEDCIDRGKTVQEGGAVYNFTGPQGFGIANMTDSLYAIRRLVFEEGRLTLAEYKQALEMNFGQGFDKISAGEIVTRMVQKMAAKGETFSTKQIEQMVTSVMNMQLSPEEKAHYEQILGWIDQVPKYGNDDPDVDAFARQVAYLYTRPLPNYRNPRGGSFQAGLYPVSANVPMGAQTGATPDGRLAHMPIADGVSPSAGKDTHGPTAAANSVSALDHGIASNGTLFNQKFHPTALSGEEGLEKFIALIRAFFDRKGSHIQFNVVDRNTLLDAQQHPEKYRGLVVRVAGYSALFTTLSKSLQDDIIRRTEQGW